MAEKDFEFLDDMIKRIGRNPDVKQKVDLLRKLRSKYIPNFTLGESSPLMGGKNLPRQFNYNYTPNFTMGEGSPIMGGKNLPKIKVGNSEAIDALKFTKDFASKAVQEGLDPAKTIVEEGIANPKIYNSKFARGWGSLMPVIGDFWDMASGKELVEHGHPYLGTAQGLAGATGLMLNAFAPTAGSFAKMGLKTGGKGVIKVGGKALGKALNKGADFMNSGKVGLTTAFVPEILAWLQGGEKELPKPKPKEEKTGEVASNGKSLNVWDLEPIKDIQGNPGNMDDFVRGLVRDNGIGAEGNTPHGDLPNTDILDVYNRLLGVQPQVQEDIIQDIQPEATESPVDESLVLDRLNNIYDIKQSNLKPYIDALKNYYNDYRDLNKLGMLADAFNAGYAGWSGNDAYKQMIGKYNPADIEAKRLDILAKLADIQTETQLGKEKLLANAELAKELGLSPSALLADSGLTKNLSDVAVAKLNNEARKEVARMNNVARLYGYDTGYSGKVDVAGINARAKLIDSLLDNETDKAIAQGKLNLAVELQKAKDRNRLQTTYMQQLPWVTDASQLNAVMKQFGIDLGDIPTVTNTVGGGSLGGISSYSNSARDAINRYDAGK